MKKNWMKLLSLLLSVVMVLCVFAACGSTDDDEGKSSKETIVGEWEGEWDFSEIYNASISAAGDEAMTKHLSVDKLNITMCFEFEKDGTYKFYVDEDALTDTINDLKDQMVEGMKGYFEEMLDGTGMNLDDLLEAQGMSLEDLVDEALDVDALFDPDDLSESGYYKYEDGKLYTSEEEGEFDEDDYALCELKGDKLTLDADESAGLDDMLKDMLPLTFKRK